MSRSRKKSPVIAWAGCGSEKEDKRQANRALRRQSKVVLDTCDDYDSLSMPVVEEVSDVYSFGKDGKVWKGSDMSPKDRRK